MTRRTGVFLIAALALSVAALGLFLCTRCDRSKAAGAPDTLVVDDAVRLE
jgi:hypothetical protein